MSNITTISAAVAIAPIAGTRRGSFDLQATRVGELRRSVSRHPACPLRAANLRRAEQELASRRTEAFPSQVRSLSRAELDELAAALLG